MKIGAAILAAGMSRRFGYANKLLVEVEGVPIIRRVVRAALDAGLDSTLLVVGHEAERIRNCLSGIPARFVMNDGYADGMGTSVAAAIRAAEVEGWDGALIAPGDLPWLTAEDFRAVRGAFERSSGQRTVVPRVRGQPGHPVCFPRSAFAELALLKGAEGGRSIALRGGGPIYVESVSGGCVRDVDNRDQLDGGRHRLR